MEMLAKRDEPWPVERVFSTFIFKFGFSCAFSSLGLGLRMHRANLYKVHKFEVAFQQYKYQQALWKSFQEKKTVTIDFASFKVDAYTQKSLEDILAIYKRYFDGNQLGCYIADIMQELAERTFAPSN